MAHLQDVLVRFELPLLIVALAALIRSGSARRLPALTTYLSIRVVYIALADALLWFGTPNSCAYFCEFWAGYIACAIAMFFVCQEIFKKVMEPVPGLRRLGLVAFRWVCIVTAVVGIGAFALPAITMSNAPVRISAIVVPVALNLGRCISILELCLLAFLALSIHTLGRTFRSRLFGISLGFGLQAAAELVNFALVKYPRFELFANLFVQITVTAVVLTWIVYFVIPEPESERKILVLPPTSVVARWNGLAAGVGQAPALAPATAPTGFFLQDIEGIVDRVLARNPVAVGSR